MAAKRILDETKVEPEPKKAKVMFTETFEEVSKQSYQLINGKETFHGAAKNGDLFTLKKLLKQGGNVHEFNDDKMTPLHLAAENGHVEIVTELLAHGAIVDQLVTYDVLKYLDKPKHSQKSALHIASENGHVDVVTVLLTNGANIDLFDYPVTNTPLNYAIKSGHTNVVKELLKFNPSLTELEIDEKLYPLQQACMDGHIEIVKLLLEKGVHVDQADLEYQETPLYYAAADGHFEIVKLLIEEGADINKMSDDLENPLKSAARFGHLLIVRYLLEKGANPNYQILEEENQSMICDPTPLLEAVDWGHVEIVKELLKHGANPNYHGNNSLHMASSSGNIEIVKELLKYGAKVDITNESNKTPLHLAMENGHKDIFQELVQNGVGAWKIAWKITRPIIMETILGGTFSKEEKYLIHSAIECNDEEMLDLLLKNGANTNLQDLQGMTPLHLAIIAEHATMVQKLLKCKANPDLQDSLGNTPLHIAVGKSNILIVETLLKHNANLHLQNTSGYTPLCGALLQNEDKIAEVLLNHGANANGLLPSGDLPYLFVACSKKRMNFVKLLIKYGADVNVVHQQGNSRIANLHLITQMSVNDPEYIDIILELLNNGADVDRTIESSITALHIAAEIGNSEVMKLLLSYNANVHFSANGFTPLHYAIQNQDDLCVTLLLEAGFNVNASTTLNHFYLHFAVIHGNASIVSKLIQHGAKVNAQHLDGKTPLHYTVLSYSEEKKSECLKIVGILLEEPIDLNFRDRDGKTALELAIAMKCHTIKRMIICKLFSNPLKF